MTNDTRLVTGFSGCLLLAAMLQPFDTLRAAPSFVEGHVSAGAQGRGPDFQGGPPFPGGFPGGRGPSAERKLVAQFDKNGDKRLECPADTTVADALSAMLTAGATDLVVRGKDGELTGHLTFDVVSRLLAAEEDEVRA